MQDETVVSKKGFASTRVLLILVVMEMEYVSTSEAATTLGITRQRVLQLIEQGTLQAHRLGSVYLIRKADLALIADRKPGRPKKSDEGQAVGTPAEIKPKKRAAKKKSKTKASVK